MPKSEEIRAEALRLRREERLSLNAIRDRLKVSKGTLSVWLRQVPLSKEEKNTRRIQSLKERGTRGGPRPKFKPSEISKFWMTCPDTEGLTPVEKARISEAAVMFRAAVMRLAVYGSPFDGDRADWIFEHRDGHLSKIQVRWAGPSAGSPVFSLRKSNGRNKQQRLEEQDFDYLVGYDLQSDTAFVYTREELNSLKSCVSAHPDAAEAWHKITAP